MIVLLEVFPMDCLRARNCSASVVDNLENSIYRIFSLVPAAIASDKQIYNSTANSASSSTPRLELLYTNFLPLCCFRISSVLNQQ